MNRVTLLSGLLFTTLILLPTGRGAEAELLLADLINPHEFVIDGGTLYFSENDTSEGVDRIQSFDLETGSRRTIATLEHATYTGHGFRHLAVFDGEIHGGISHDATVYRIKIDIETGEVQSGSVSLGSSQSNWGWYTGSNGDTQFLIHRTFGPSYIKGDDGSSVSVLKPRNAIVDDNFIFYLSESGNHLFWFDVREGSPSLFIDAPGRPPASTSAVINSEAIFFCIPATGIVKKLRDETRIETDLYVSDDDSLVVLHATENVLVFREAGGLKMLPTVVGDRPATPFVLSATDDFVHTFVSSDSDYIYWIDGVEGESDARSLYRMKSGVTVRGEQITPGHANRLRETHTDLTLDDNVFLETDGAFCYSVITPDLGCVYAIEASDDLNGWVELRRFSPDTLLNEVRIDVDTGYIASRVRCVEESSRFLTFPLKGSNPTTHRVTSVFDHDERYEWIRTWNGEVAAREYTENPRHVIELGNPPKDYFQFNNEEGGAFLSTDEAKAVMNYDPFPSDPLAVTFLAYDDHRGYDYGSSAGATLIAPMAGRLFAATDTVYEERPDTLPPQKIWRLQDDANPKFVGRYPNPNDRAPKYTYDVLNLRTFYIVHENGYSSWFVHCLLSSEMEEEIAQFGYAEVVRGQVIGIVNPNPADFGPHLHYTLRRQTEHTGEIQYSELVDPYGKLDENGIRVEPILWR